MRASVGATSGGVTAPWFGLALILYARGDALHQTPEEAP